MTTPIKCDCGYWDRDKPHSRLGGGACKYAYELLRQENERLRQLATQRGARMQIMWEWMGATAPLSQYFTVRDQFLWAYHRENYSAWFDDDGVPVE